MSEDDEPDFFGRTGEKSQCHCCEGRGLYWNETCFVCAGYGWVREDEPMTNTDAKIMREAGLRVLVCGGRDYREHGTVWQVLGGIHDRRPIGVIIEGGATGADRWCAKWAACQPFVEVETYPANWSAHGKAAGPIRNQRMLDEGRPDLVVAFPGGRGTADMVRRAKAAGIEVREIRP